jgi:LDH2 family malate/lactate/ureidoglycolate dehydrogenase
MSERALLFPAHDLRSFAEDLLKAVGVPAPKAALVASSLVAANLRAVDTHGVQLLAYYLERIERRAVDPLAEGRVVSESGGCLVYDGGNGLGQVVSEICCGHAVRLAREHGIAIVVARDSNHFGAAAFWAQRISEGGCLGIVMCNSSAIVPPWQGREGRIGTNPICMSVPGDGGRPWLLDMATTTVAAGKVFKAFLSGQASIPPGWALDREGVPTTDTREAYAGMLMPLGGYKGSGLGMMVEILCGVLGGGAMSTEVGGIRSPGAARTSQMFLAADVSRLMPLGEFRERMQRLVARVKSAQPAAGYQEVLVAGDPEWRAEELRLREGIPVSLGVWEKLAAEAARLNVPAPQGTPMPGSY